MDEWTILKTRVKDHCGLIFDGQRDTYFRNKVQARMQELHCNSAVEYLQYLNVEDKDKNEWQKLINEVTINETYFFRENQQFKVLAKTVLPELMKTREPFYNLRLLCAACSNGAEPYTLAMTLAKLPAPWQLEIEACDLSDKNLAVARQGVYGDFDLRTTEPLAKASLFEQKGSHYQLALAVRQSVRFFQLNLLDFAKIRSLVPYQVIFCRNVLYYFDIATREKVICALADALSAGGFLFVGQTEFIGELAIPFKPCREGDVLFYRKVDNKKTSAGDNKATPTEK